MAIQAAFVSRLQPANFDFIVLRTITLAIPGLLM